jgi:mRNA interferase HigB
VRKAKWKNTADVKRLYATASVVTADRIVFNIKGNDYRLVASVDFEKELFGSSGSGLTVSTTRLM